jgi:hypothetical protein
MLAHLADRVLPIATKAERRIVMAGPSAAANGFGARKVSIDADEIQRFWSA